MEKISTKHLLYLTTSVVTFFGIGALAILGIIPLSWIFSDRSLLIVVPLGVILAFVFPRKKKEPQIIIE